MTTRYVDPVLLAASDCLVLTALERAGARALPRAARAGERHTAYLRFPIAREKVDHALAGAWALAPLLAARHDLDLDVAAWCSVLDDYARALLLMTQPHTPAQLRPHLYPVAVSRPATRPYLEVAAG